MFFFQKKNCDIRNQKLQKNSSFSISFLFLRIFGMLYSIGPIQTCPKIMKFFVVFYWMG